MIKPVHEHKLTVSDTELVDTDNEPWFETKTTSRCWNPEMNKLIEALDAVAKTITRLQTDMNAAARDVEALRQAFEDDLFSESTDEHVQRFLKQEFDFKETSHVAYLSLYQATSESGPAKESVLLREFLIKANKRATEPDVDNLRQAINYLAKKHSLPLPWKRARKPASEKRQSPPPEAMTTEPVPATIDTAKQKPAVEVFSVTSCIQRVDQS